MDYQSLSKELKKRGLSTNGQSGGGTSTNGAYASQLVNELQKRDYQFGQTGDQNDELLGGFLQKGAFADGFQLSDIWTARWGTAADIVTHVAKGVVQTAEGVADALSYGTAGIVDLLGDKQWADDIRENAKFSVSDWAFDSVTKALDEASILGHMSESVAEGVGQVGVMAATGGVAGAAGLGKAATSAITLGTMGVSSMGSGMGEAYEGGATNKEALAYGLISGTAETLSEMMFGGLGKGVNALGFNKGLLDADDLVAKKVSSIFKSTLMKNISEMGVKAVGEGLEEVVSGIASAIGKKVTYMDDESLDKIFSNENLLEQFVVGAVTSGITQAPGMVKNTKSKTDYVTGRTQSEQSVVDSEIKSRIEAKEKETGKKLTNKEKTKIYSEVENELKKGYISPETIEKTMGGEAYEQYQKLVNESDEFNNLYDTPYEKLSEKQRDRLAELKEKNKANSYDDAIYNAYENLKNKVTDNGNSFKESYNERGRRAQKFQADVSKYDEKYRSTVQKAIDSGILNNTNRSHEFVDLVSKISAETGTQFDFANNKKLAESGLALEGLTVNGVTTGDGVTINMDSAKALNTVVGHEVTHILEGTDLYNALQTAIFDYAKGKGEFDSRRAALEKLYKDVEGADIDAELTADLVGDYLFTDEAFLQNLSTKHRNVFQKLYDQIKHLCKLATAGSKEARELERVKNAFEKAYREAGESAKNTAKDGGVKYSISEIVDRNGNSYGVGVHLDSTLLDNLTPKERVEMVKEYIKELGGESFTAYDANGDAVDISIAEPDRRFKNKNGKTTPVNRDLTTKYIGNEVKQESITLIDELIATAEYQSQKQPNYSHGWLDGNGQNNWEYWQTYVQDKSGDVWQATLNIANAETGEKILYDVNPIKKVGQSVKSDTSLPFVGQSVKSDTSSTDNSISNSGENVNTKFSLSDSQGRQLTNDQVEYFKNSKVRDENGSLKTVYHGTGAEFTEFSYQFMGAQGSSEGRGFYFTDNPDMAKGYQNNGVKLMEGYLDIEKPLSDSEVTMKRSELVRLLKAIDPSGDDVIINYDSSGIGYPSKAWYNRALNEAVEAIYNGNESDSEILAEIANSGSDNETVLKKVRELFGYDGYIVKGKYDDATVYVAFESNQFKDVDNRTPTVNPDIRYSLSPEGEQSTQYGNYNVYGEDVKNLGWDDIAPPTESNTTVADDIAPTREKIAEMDKERAKAEPPANADLPVERANTQIDIAPTVNRYDSLLAQKNNLEEKIAAWFESGDTESPEAQQEYMRLNDAWKDVDTQIRAWEAKASDVELTKTAVTNISRSVRQLLGLSNNQMADARSLVEKYSNRSVPTREELYSEVKNLFGEYTEKVTDDGLKQAQKDLRTYGISVSEDIKSQIADYNDLRKRNFGKIRFSKDGVAVDVAYQELQEIAPGYFPSDIVNPADQLMRIIDVANMQSETVNRHEVDAETLGQATDTIIDGVNEYKHKKLQRMVYKQNYAPIDTDAVRQNRQSSAGVPFDELAPPIDTTSGQQTFTQEAAAEADAEANRLITRAEVHERKINEVKAVYESAGFDFDEVLKNSKDLSTFATVDNTPQRVLEKALGWKEGKILSDLTVDQVARNEAAAIQWINSFTGENGVLRQISQKYNIKPGSKKSAAAQMYAEGFYVNEKNEIVKYGDAELSKDFPNAQDQKDIKGLSSDPQIRKIYDETLNLINEARVRNGYAPIPRLDNYFLHFRAMQDTFSTLGLPFNPNDIRAKDLPTDLNGVTADLKPGQPYFASAQHRRGKRTSFDLLGGLEMYLNSAKSQIYHIDDIQMLRALRNYIADNYGQAKGLESIDTMSEEAAQERIKEVYNSHLSTLAKFLNEEANVLAGKTSLVDRGLEGILGRRGIQTLETINRQVGANMVGFNISSSLTNFLSVAQATAKTNKYDMLKAFTQTVSNRLTGTKDAFIENNPTVLRRRGAERFYRTPWQKVSDIGYKLAGAVDDVATEMIVRGKYNELTRKGMDSQTAITETDKWVSRLMGDRSLGQQPQIYNSKMLGICTKYQLEVRNQLDAMFYDTIQESKTSAENISNEMKRNATTAAKATATIFQLAALQHLFGVAFEAVAGYNPAFDIISVMMTAFGFDDDEDSEDTALDNVEQAFLELLDDMPYTSTLTGGRVPIASALPIEELVTGKDSYGNEKSRLETVAEALPYYLLPGGYGQFKKTIKGLSMFDDDLPVTGSYTDSGNLRFPVEDTVGNRVQAALFGQYANKNGRDYFDNDWSTLKENQISEYAELGVSVKEYRQIRSEMSKIEGDKDADGNTISGSKKKNIVQYIDGLDLTAAQKVILYNGQYESEEDRALERLTASFDDGDYWAWLRGLSAIESDKDANGKTISGSRKRKVVELLNSLEYLDYGQKIILFRSEFQSDDTYCAEIAEYINNLDGLDYTGRVEILKALGFRISDDGTAVYW